MAVSAIQSSQIAQVDGVLKLRVCRRLAKHGVANRAVLADPFSIAADVLVIVTTETAQRVQMAGVIAMRAPVHTHLRETCRRENVLQRDDGAIDRGLL